MRKKSHNQPDLFKHAAWYESLDIRLCEQSFRVVLGHTDRIKNWREPGFAENYCGFGQ